jgi:hypothetical protein
VIGRRGCAVYNLVAEMLVSRLHVPNAQQAGREGRADLWGFLVGTTGSTAATAGRAASRNASTA